MPTWAGTIHGSGTSGEAKNRDAGISTVVIGILQYVLYRIHVFPVPFLFPWLSFLFFSFFFSFFFLEIRYPFGTDFQKFHMYPNIISSIHVDILIYMMIYVILRMLYICIWTIGTQVAPEQHVRLPVVSSTRAMTLGVGGANSYGILTLVCPSFPTPRYGSFMPLQLSNIGSMFIYFWLGET